MPSQSYYGAANWPHKLAKRRPWLGLGCGLLALSVSCSEGEGSVPNPTPCAQSVCDAGNEVPAPDAEVTPPGDADAGVVEPEPYKPSEPLAGCEPRREAIPLYPNAEVASAAPGDAPILCAVQTGMEAPFNTSIAITDEGHVFFGPTQVTGVIRCRDNGATWEGPMNAGPHPLNGNWGHPWLWRDKDTGRMFFTTYNSFAGPCLGGTGHNYWWSEDDGETWTAVPEGVGCGLWDWGKIVTGPAARESSRTALQKNGYPNIVYFCAGSGVYALGPDHGCYRSLDGGKTFERTKGNAIDAVRNGQSAWPNAGTVTPDGTFYKAYPHEGGLALTYSKDEGDTWSSIPGPVSKIAGNFNTLNFLSNNVTHDEEGTLYVSWVDDSDLNPYIAYSKDQGKTWSKPLMVGAPGVKASCCVNASVKRPGYVSVAYFGSPKAEGTGNGHSVNDGRPYDAYLSVSTNIFADKPLFWSSKINPEDEFAVKDGMTLLVTEYLGEPVYGPDGSIWVGVIMDKKGLVGRMLPPPE